MRGICLLAAAVAVLGVASCGGTDDESAVPASHLVGEVSEVDAFIGVVVRTDGSVLAYVCDGEKLGMWATGDVDGTHAELAATSGSGGIDVDFADGEPASGTVRLPDGRSVSFQADPATGHAGLFRRQTARDDGVSGGSQLTGWVVLPDGRTKGTSSDASSTASATAAPTSADKVSEATLVQRCPATLPEGFPSEESIEAFGPPSFRHAAICGLPSARRGSSPPPEVVVIPGNEKLEKEIDKLQAAVDKTVADCLAKSSIPPNLLRVQKAYPKLKEIAAKLKADPKFVVASSNLRARIEEAKDPKAIAAAEGVFRSFIPPSAASLLEDLEKSANEAAAKAEQQAAFDCFGPFPEVDAGPSVQTLEREDMASNAYGLVVGDATYSAKVIDNANGLFGLSTSVDVGSDSYAEATALLLAIFDVPAGTERVTITVRGDGSGYGFKIPGFGEACDSSFLTVLVFDQVDYEVDDAATHYNWLDCGFPPAPPSFIAEPPVPDPPNFIPGVYNLEFEPDHPGTYVVSIRVHVEQETSLFASGIARLSYFVDEIEVAFDS